MREILTEAVQLGEDFWYNALPVGKFHDPRYGKVSITPTLVKKLAASFGKATSYPLPVKLGHGDGAPSPGTIKAVKAESDGLHIQFDLDDEAAKDVRERRYRFMSAEYAPDYTDKGTGEKIGPALLGVALVNQPAHPGVLPIAFSDGEWKQENKGGSEVDESKLKELETKLAEMEAERVKLSEERDELRKMAEDAAAEAARMKEERRVAEVEAFCEGYVSKGVPPSVVNKIKPVLLSEASVIKLADGAETSLIRVFGEVLDEMPKVSLAAKGQQAGPEDRNVVLAEQIERVARKVNGQKE